MLPHDDDIQLQTAYLLDTTVGGRLHCQDVYKLLAKSFPNLTSEETTAPYRRSVSHWANRVQFARLHMIRKGWLLDPSISGRGIWAISEEGRRAVAASKATADRLLRQLRRS